MAASRTITVTALGIAQILGWGSSFYFPAVLAQPIVADTGWSLSWVVGGASLGMLVAGLISPRVGAAIDRRGGRPVLALSSLLYAAGLSIIGLAPNLATFLGGWMLVGGGMGSGLYDAAFAVLGKMYGKDARTPITNLTLFGGFSSTVCWPLSAFLAESLGWRGACLTYAALHLVVALPLQMAVVPRLEAPQAAAPAAAPSTASAAPNANERTPFALLALVLTIAAGIGSIVVVHLLIFLHERGVEPASAVALGTLFGPAQVGARLIERLAGPRYHPIWTMVASCALMAVGLVMLWAHLRLPALVILLYGAGYGIMWIARGTLPLALFGAQRYPVLVGKLAFPSLVVQALAPSAGALLIERCGANAAIALLAGFALANVVLIVMLLGLVRRRS